MKNVANKKIIRTMSYRTMREKKWKNLIAVLAIALTTLLFTALFTVAAPCWIPYRRRRCAR